MKSMFSLLTALVLLCSAMTQAFAADKPTCVLLKFSNDTRYKNIDTESLLSDLVVEKLLVSGKINLVESIPIGTDVENLLYNEKVNMLVNAESSLNKGNFNALFEGPGFDPKYADSISTAQVGQIISPEIMSKIGKNSGADYIIHGTIINMGYGEWMNDSQDTVSNILGGLLTLVGLPGGSGFLSNNAHKGIALQSELRLIKAATGEVVWCKKIICLSDKSVESLNARLADVKLQSETYANLMEFSAEEITNNLLDDLKKGKLFAQ